MKIKIVCNEEEAIEAVNKGYQLAILEHREPRMIAYKDDSQAEGYWYCCFLHFAQKQVAGAFLVAFRHAVRISDDDEGNIVVQVSRDLEWLINKIQSIFKVEEVDGQW